MSQENTLAGLVPAQLLRLIRDRIKAGVADAEAMFYLNEEEEDSISGALGQAIATKDPIVLQSEQGMFSFEIKAFKIRGRGPNAPEKHLGADGIIQIRATKFDDVVFTKGLPFQAKKTGGFTSATVRRQAEDLARTAHVGIILKYKQDDYTGVNINEILAAQDSPVLNPRKIVPRKLSAILGDDFLDCNIGRRGLYYDKHAVSFGKKGAWVISTEVRQLSEHVIVKA
jgi:hypothetical protein